jgi:hypothetical protein
MKTDQLLGILSALTFLGSSLSGAEPITPDLQKLANSRNAHWIAEAKGKSALQIRDLLWLDGVTFGNGTIEIDILGKSAPPQGNFLGVAFRGVDEKTYDCVYFRPFNFRATDSEKASHAVQYTSEPQWPWAKLRQEKTGQYEKAITPAPDGDAWFHAKIVIADKKVSVFVNGADRPSLSVETLNDRTTGKIGLWAGAGAGQGGHFANLKITPAAP